MSSHETAQPTPVASSDDRAVRGHIPWHQLGEEPDYRFSLANERTFLAWIRTALALMAGAIGVTVVHAPTSPRAALAIVSVTLAVLAVIISALAYAQWAAKQASMRLNRPLPRSGLLIPLCVAMTLVGLLIGVVVAAL